jgi:hypothetical protein
MQCHNLGLCETMLANKTHKNLQIICLFLRRDSMVKGGDYAQLLFELLDDTLDLATSLLVPDELGVLVRPLEHRDTRLWVVLWWWWWWWWWW